MTTEVIAAATYGLNGCPPAAIDNYRIVSAYMEGKTAREIGNAFLSNPYLRMSDCWRDWRSGWLRQDLGSKDRDLY